MGNGIMTTKARGIARQKARLPRHRFTYLAPPSPRALRILRWVKWNPWPHVSPAHLVIFNRLARTCWKPTDLDDPYVARIVAKRYLEIIGRFYQWHTGLQPNDEVYVRGWFGGINGWRDIKAVARWLAVQRFFGTKGAGP